jgi:hypothetical protein
MGGNVKGKHVLSLLDKVDRGLLSLLDKMNKCIVIVG